MFKTKKRAHEYYSKNKDKFIERNKERILNMNPKQLKIYREIDKKRSREFYLKNKKIVFEHYGNKCECCGETHPEFLTIDHKNGDGNKHRRALAGKSSIYVYIIKHNFPKIFRILCYNCNCSRGFSGYCPHEREHKL